MRKTTHEIIDEIAAHYNLGNRSVEMRAFEDKDGLIEEREYSCLYNSPDGKHCAFAYMCIDPSKLEEYCGVKDLFRDDKVTMDDLKEEYRGHDIGFYSDLQAFHDTRDYWTEEGLNEFGKNKVESLKNKWPVL